MKNALLQEALNVRKSTYSVDPLIMGRWSPRSMTGEEVRDEDLMAMFEAAHWAPSSFNAQPWRFIYAKRGTSHWDTLFSLMVEFNQSWAAKAGALVLVLSHKVFERNGKPSVTHSYDTGAAWAYFALEGASRGLVVHGMQGFDYEKAREVCSVPDDYQVEAMAAVGIQGSKDDLPESAREKEAPSTRKSLKDLVMEGRYKKTERDQ